MFSCGSNPVRRSFAILTAILITAALSYGGQAVTVIVGTPPPAEARPADAHPGPEGDTRRICRLERATGSNMQQRVCRDVPSAGVQDQQTRDFLRAMQQVQVPSDGLRASPRPVGSPLE